MSEIPAFNETKLRALCDLPGDTASGLTVSGTGQLLPDCGIDATFSSYTIRHAYSSASRSVSLTTASACSRSAMRSSVSSMPTE